jgi:hypothetical protein
LISAEAFGKIGCYAKNKGKMNMRTMFLIAAAVAVFCAGAAPLNIAVYVGAGARNVGVFRWLEIASRAKDAVLTPVDADAIRAGALDSADVLVIR